MAFARIRKCTYSTLNDAFASRLRLACRFLQNRYLFVLSPKQPHRPKCATQPYQQHIHALKVDHSRTLPIEQSAFQSFPAALVPPATRILHKTLLCRLQTRNQIPHYRSVSLARQLVATHVRPSHAAFPNAHLLKEATAPRLQAQRTQRLPPARGLDLRVGACPKHIFPAQALQTGQKWLTSMDAVSQHDDACLAGQIVRQCSQQLTCVFSPGFIGGVEDPAKRQADAISSLGNAKDTEIVEMARFVNREIEFGRRHFFEQLLNERIID